MIKALVIDDEQNGRNTLIGMLNSHCPEIEVIGQANSVKTGVELVNELQPNLIFLDIEMPDGTGFDLLSQLNSLDLEVVFVTAFEKYAVRAFQFSAIDYILKPINPALLKTAVEKAKKAKSVDELRLKIDALLGNSEKLEKIVLPTAEGTYIVKIENIIRCLADNNYTIFYLNDGNNITVSKTLKEYSETLENHNFFRTHQSHLINLEYVERFVNTDGGYLVMKGGDQVVVSRRRKKLLMDTLMG